MKKEYSNLITAVVVILVIVLAMVIYLSFPLMTGETVVLKTQPVDPFDIFRGQYITIGFDISRIPAIEGANVPEEVFVNLKKNESVWIYDSASLVKPSDGTFIKGKITNVYGDFMNVNYGIEQYFFERNAEFSTQNLSVEVKISDSGNARISRLLQNGKPLKISYENKSLLS